MRMFRALRSAWSLALVGALGLPAVAQAQGGRPFTDAWFWGLKAGGISYATSEASNRFAPTAGIDWLVTRTNGGVYLGYDFGFLTEQARVVDEGNPDNSGTRLLDLKGLHRFSIAAMAFPGRARTLRPYGGIGFALHRIGTVTPRGDFSSDDAALATVDSISEYRATFTPTLILGAQYRFRPISAFAQTTVAAAQERFFLHGGRSFIYGIEIGARYNIGASIDRGR